jgi:8-amino-7-oxononanoate synthase
LEEAWEIILENRKAQNLFRQFGSLRKEGSIDFYSNDYLGLCHFAESQNLFREELKADFSLGSSGSRLVSGQQEELEQLERECSRFFKSETGLFFPNGFMANLALFSCMATRHDTILFDEQAHVSIKEGIRLSLAGSFPFLHNNPEDLEKKLKKAKGRKFVAIEGIYSMSGHLASLKSIVEVCKQHQAYLIIDEAHSTGVLGEAGEGLALSEKLENQIWVRNYTFGKALGTAGAFLALSPIAREFLTNFSFPLIYSTSPSPLQVKVCRIQLKQLKEEKHRIPLLQSNIRSWLAWAENQAFEVTKNAHSPVQFIRIRGNEKALALAKFINEQAIQIKAMLKPTVREGEEGLRVSLHSQNLPSDFERLAQAIKDFENIFGSRF